MRFYHYIWLNFRLADVEVGVVIIFGGGSSQKEAPHLNLHFRKPMVFKKIECTMYLTTASAKNVP